jgi:apolipoprotein N-acyltransferase
MNRYISGTGQKTLYSLLSGGIAPFAFSPFDIYPLAVLSVVLIIYLWSRSDPRTAFYTGYLYGLGFFGSGVSWLHISINLFGGVNIAGAVFLTFLLIAFLSLYPAITGYLATRLSSGNHKGLSLVLGVPVLWALGEWIRSWLLTGFPWLNLGYSQTDSALAGLAPVCGVFGISLAVVFTAAAIVSLLNAGRKKQLLLGIVIVLVWAGSWLLGKVEWTTGDGGEISVAVIQGAVPQEIKWRPEMRGPTMDLYRDLTQPHLQRDLIIWPEAAIPAYFHQVPGFIDELSGSVQARGNHLLTGMPVYENSSENHYNGVVLLGNETRFYFKKHLVPFGEYLPLDFLLGGLIRFFNIPISDFSAGPDVRPVLDAGGFRIGISVCYEDTFGEEVIQAIPEAGILVNISNDAWFGDSAAPHQHLQMARMRAQETGRHLLRATNTGISAIIDEKGRIVSRIPQFEPGSISGNVPLFSGHTPYSRTGNYPVVLVCLLVLGIFLYRKKIRKKNIL